MRWFKLFLFSTYILSTTPLEKKQIPSQQADQMAPISNLKSETTVPKKNSFQTYTIGLSVGGTKIAGAAVFANGTTEAHESFDWRAQLGNQATVEDFIQGIVTVVEKIKEQNQSRDLQRIGLAFPGPGEYDKGYFSPINIPLPNQYPIKQVLEERLNIPVVTLHDGAASVLGETSVTGTLPGVDNAMIVIVGTGIGGGVKKNGSHYYGKNSIGELGWSLWYEKPESIEDEEIYYIYAGEHSYSDFIQKMDHLKSLGHIPVEQRLAGPALAKRFVRYTLTETNVAKSNDFFQENVIDLLRQLEAGDASAEKRVLQKITQGAQKDYYGCYKFIQVVGKELGIALGTYVSSHFEELFVRHIVLVSGVGENFGKGVLNDQGQDLWLESIRQGVLETLSLFGKDPKISQEIIQGIIRSQMTHEREILAFTPSKKAPIPASVSDLEKSL